MEWRDISSAPKDGAWIILYDDRFMHSHQSYLIAQWQKGLNVWAGKPNSKGRFPIWDDATHWIPLPPPPNEGNGDE